MSDTYQVACCDNLAYVRVDGLANMKNAPLLDAFLRQERDHGVVRVFVDLSRCTGMDSTFMGTLVAHHMELSERTGHVVVVNPTPRNRQLLDMLGVSEVVPVVGDEPEIGCEFVTLSETVLSTAERAAMIQRAHQHLAQISDENRTKFAPFLDALAKDLGKR
ncbi:MAG: STAS domain-containing protein [Planctomycetota bacterium]|jgi:anti-anti-sigma factor